ncbi:MAG: hypothetical protein OXD33_00245 [Rhodobacteraceae bacterium]|nr:hypothetical protein [Paracoccaceae bacterium]
MQIQKDEYPSLSYAEVRHRASQLRAQALKQGWVWIANQVRAGFASQENRQRNRSSHNRHAV